MNEGERVGDRRSEIRGGREKEIRGRRQKRKKDSNGNRKKSAIPPRSSSHKAGHKGQKSNRVKGIPGMMKRGSTALWQGFGLTLRWLLLVWTGKRWKILVGAPFWTQHGVVIYRGHEKYKACGRETWRTRVSNSWLRRCAAPRVNVKVHLRPDMTRVRVLRTWLLLSTVFFFPLTQAYSTNKCPSDDVQWEDGDGMGCKTRRIDTLDSYATRTSPRGAVSMAPVASTEYIYESSTLSKQPS